MSDQDVSEDEINRSDAEDIDDIDDGSHKDDVAAFNEDMVSKYLS